MSTSTLAERAVELIARSKDDRAIIAGSEVREIARGYLDALEELRKLRTTRSHNEPLQPPVGSGWVLHPDGSYWRGLEHLYFDAHCPTTSGTPGLWFKKHPHEERGRPVSGGPAQGFWGDDTEP
jgi:hypothetical protein